MLWDLHCHLSGIDGDTPDLRMANLIRFADRMGIERVVVFMGYPFATDPTAEELRVQNDQVLQALSHWHDRAFGFAYVSPKHVDASLAEIDRCIRNGPLVGIKLWVAGHCSDTAVDAIVQRCAELQGVIFQHTWNKANGNLPGESTAEDMAVLAARHPATPLICGHTGGDWELGIRAIRAHLNVSIDLGGSDPTAGIVEMAVRELGAERIIFGSDAPGRSFASQLAKVNSADISSESRSLILGGNLKRLLLPILRAKGIA
ncbi:MAG: amidohydrolase family protein [Planctomycetaceae bacterium]|nr:amidohydrolase family protein [Planctomycetaceae bacterium]